jgi:hypothetical protein
MKQGSTDVLRPTPVRYLLSEMRRRLSGCVLILSVLTLFAGQPAWSSAQGTRDLSIHQAWLVTKKDAYGVAQSAEKRAGGLDVGEFSDAVQPESACVRHSRYEVDCPFSYVLGSTEAENYEQCRDTARLLERAEQRVSFSAQRPRCRLINNETS